jgi:hypothetical protein
VTSACRQSGGLRRYFDAYRHASQSDRATQHLWRGVEEPVPSVAEGTSAVLSPTSANLSRTFFLNTPTESSS